MKFSKITTVVLTALIFFAAAGPFGQKSTGSIQAARDASASAVTQPQVTGVQPATRKEKVHQFWPYCAKPVCIVSIAMHEKGIERTLGVIEREAAAGADLILLTETWPGGKAFTLDEPPTTALAKLAQKYHVYIVSPIYRRDGDTVFNSSVLIDRDGKVAGIYNKVYPVLGNPSASNNEFLNYGIENGLPGHDVPVFKTDFGRIGMAICFDAQFPEVWQRLADNDAELVLFSSAYSAGRSLGAYAMAHHYYVVSATWSGECQTYDITGEELLDEHEGISRMILDFDRRIFHNNDSYNYTYDENGKRDKGGKRKKLLKENPGVELEKYMAREGWHVLRATKPGVDLTALIKQYDIQDLRSYLQVERKKADKMRGYQFKRIGPTQKNSSPTSDKSVR